MGSQLIAGHLSMKRHLNGMLYYYANFGYYFETVELLQSRHQETQKGMKDNI